MPFEALLYVNMSVGCQNNYSEKSTICFKSVCLSCQPLSGNWQLVSIGKLWRFIRLSWQILSRQVIGRNYLAIFPVIYPFSLADTISWRSGSLPWQKLSGDLSVFPGRHYLTICPSFLADNLAADTILPICLVPAKRFILRFWVHGFSLDFAM